MRVRAVRDFVSQLLSPSGEVPDSSMHETSETSGEVTKPLGYFIYSK